MVLLFLKFKFFRIKIRKRFLLPSLPSAFFSHNALRFLFMWRASSSLMLLFSRQELSFFSSSFWNSNFHGINLQEDFIPKVSLALFGISINLQNHLTFDFLHVVIIFTKLQHYIKLYFSFQVQPNFSYLTLYQTIFLNKIH